MAKTKDAGIKRPRKPPSNRAPAHSQSTRNNTPTLESVKAPATDSSSGSDSGSVDDQSVAVLHQVITQQYMRFIRQARKRAGQLAADVVSVAYLVTKEGVEAGSISFCDADSCKRWLASVIRRISFQAWRRQAHHDGELAGHRTQDGDFTEPVGTHPAFDDATVNYTTWKARRLATRRALSAVSQEALETVRLFGVEERGRAMSHTERSRLRRARMALVVELAPFGIADARFLPGNDNCVPFGAEGDDESV